MLSGQKGCPCPSHLLERKMKPFSFRRAKGISCNWWARSCSLFTFLKWAQSNCTATFTNPLCKIKPSWKPVWGHKMPSLSFSSVPVKNAAKTSWVQGGGGGGKVFALMAFYFLSTVQLQQDSLPVCLDLTSCFTIKAKHNVSRNIKPSPQGPVLQWLQEWQCQIRSPRQMFSRCAECLPSKLDVEFIQNATQVVPTVCR